jgi:hypothetical protein
MSPPTNICFNYSYRRLIALVPLEAIVGTRLGLSPLLKI